MTRDGGMSLGLSSAWLRYPGAADWAMRDVTLEFTPGVHSAVLGPNGAGKSTLLRALAGLLACDRGEAYVEGRESGDWPRRELARRMAFVSSTEEGAFPVRVREYVGLGRNPYLGSFGPPGDEDRAIVGSALERTDMQGLAERYVTNLSAGELQRARVARALAQEPAILLLDEPTAHLDIGHEYAVFDLLSQLVAELSITIISVTHNINMASRFASRVVLMRAGAVVADGQPESVLTPMHLGTAFDWPVHTVRPEGLGCVALPVRRGGEVAEGA
ncbi:MAG: ABC transporter ATP-binding protein [Gemmatimonadota bacterium]